MSISSGGRPDSRGRATAGAGFEASACVNAGNYVLHRSLVDRLVPEEMVGAVGATCVLARITRESFDKHVGGLQEIKDTSFNERALASVDALASLIDERSAETQPDTCRRKATAGVLCVPVRDAGEGGGVLIQKKDPCCANSKSPQFVSPILFRGP